MAESWVINASPIILLAKAGLIDRVPSLANPFVIPEPVAAEILTSPSQDAAVLWLNEAGKEYVRPAVPELARLSESEVGLGERAVISWAAAHRDFTAVLDDFEARVAAQHLAIPVIGTVGVILRLKKAGLISEVKPLLLKIKSVGGYISDELFREALLRAGEQP